MINDMGKELSESNERIVQCLSHLREQRDELAYLIGKQNEERRKLEMELERISYKLCLINKSLMQRERAKNNYDKTLTEIEQKYYELVKNSGELLGIVQKEYNELDSIINKKTNTEVFQMGDDEKTCCLPQETTRGFPFQNCKCDERKESIALKTLKQASQLKAVDIEEPIKLEKTEGSLSPGGSDPEVSETADDASEGKEEKKQDDKHDDESEGASDYSLHFRKYS